LTRERPRRTKDLADLLTGCPAQDWLTFSAIVLVMMGHIAPIAVAFPRSKDNVSGEEITHLRSSKPGQVESVSL